MNLCGIPGCESPIINGWGWCNAHYKKYLKYGNPTETGAILPRGFSKDELFQRKIEKTETCWLWTGKINKRGQGYGDFTYRDRDQGGKPVTVPAHRYAYELWVGPIPEGMTIDHVWDNGCRHTHCVRPEHLEPVTPAEQNRRYYGRQTHCKWDHEFTPENTRWGGPNGNTRYCKECGRRRVNAHYRKTHPLGIQLDSTS